MNNLENEQLLEVENQYWVTLWNDLQVLREDKRFQRVIMQAYFKDRAVNGVSMLANPSTIANNTRSDIMESLIAISRLEDFFIMVENLGNISPDDTEEE